MKQEPDGFLTGEGRRVRGREKWERGGMETKWGVEGMEVREGKDPDGMNGYGERGALTCQTK